MGALRQIQYGIRRQPIDHAGVHCRGAVAECRLYEVLQTGLGLPQRLSKLALELRQAALGEVRRRFEPVGVSRHNPGVAALRQRGGVAEGLG